MSTRSNIYLRLKEETKGTTIKFDPTKLPQPEGDREFPIKDVNVPKDGNLDSKKAICEEYAYKWWISYYEWNDKTKKSRCTGWLNLESELKR